jgi:hypothetical protein
MPALSWFAARHQEKVRRKNRAQKNNFGSAKLSFAGGV